MHHRRPLDVQWGRKPSLFPTRLCFLASRNKNKIDFGTLHHGLRSTFIPARRDRPLGVVLFHQSRCLAHVSKVMRVGLRKSHAEERTDDAG